MHLGQNPALVLAFFQPNLSRLVTDKEGLVSNRELVNAEYYMFQGAWLIVLLLNRMCWFKDIGRPGFLGKCDILY